MSLRSCDKHLLPEYPQNFKKSKSYYYFSDSMNAVTASFDSMNGRNTSALALLPIYGTEAATLGAL